MDKAFDTLASGGIEWALVALGFGAFGWLVKWLLGELKEARKELIALIKESNEVIRNSTISLDAAIRHLENKRG